MKTTPLESRVIPLRTGPNRGRRKPETRKVFVDAFLFLLFLNVMALVLVLSYLNNKLFLEQLLTGGFIVGALLTFKWINREY